MLDGAKLKDLTVVPDDRGMLLEMFRSDDSDYHS